MRKIKIVSMSEQTTRLIETDVNTWGELKTLLESGDYKSDSPAVAFDLENTESKIKENKLSFDNSTKGLEAKLPTGLGVDKDFTLYIVSKKIKAGNYVTNEVLLEKIKELEATILSILKERAEELEPQIEDDNYNEVFDEIIDEDLKEIKGFIS